MKSRLAALALSIACLSTTAEASIEVGDDIYLTRGPGAVGGLFNVRDLDDGPGSDFGTFCVEITETIRLGANYRYYVYNISNTNHANGGANKPLLTLGNYAAWLYTQYRDPTAAYPIAIEGTNGQKNAIANALQWAIWQSMGYSVDDINGVVNWNLSTLQPYLITWSNNYAADSDWPKTGNYTGGVQIMSLATALNPDGTPAAGSLAQDQLVWTPAPEPATLIVWGSLTCVAGLVAFFRRPS